jgi:hypothetical protein
MKSWTTKKVLLKTYGENVMMIDVNLTNRAMWRLVLEKEFGDVVVQKFRTKKEAQDEIRNRERLVQHLTKRTARGVYKIQKG